MIRLWRDLEAEEQDEDEDEIDGARTESIQRFDSSTCSKEFQRWA